MKIAVLSGKGGTGKTLVSVNLAAVAEKSIYVDCDVEEPNGHLFFKPEFTGKESVSVKMPLVDAQKCTGCRKCVDFCMFNALAHTGKELLIFEEVCHSCGGCSLVCPVGAMSEKDKITGEVRMGVSGNVSVFTGMLNIGEASGIPLIKKLFKETRGREELILIDCPPGSACIVMESIKDADYCLLVAEPSVFGAHNLEMVEELVSLFGKPHGVVLNKCQQGENPSEEFCRRMGVKILASIPYDKKLGEINSNGLILVREDDVFREMFLKLLDKIKEDACHEAAFNTQR
ncbi:MAG: 4Fe-4S binding protein [Acholeplasmataceae bacterium]|nr:ATP-binding protein [Acidaminococcaceae bacterium]NLY83995.1 4Fe-4S binding protein [Acholeplasmataceae bacterium]